MSTSPSPARWATRAPASQHLRPSLHANGAATPEGSATQTITSTASSVGDGLVLRLRGAHEPSTSTSAQDPSTESRRRIQWAEDVVDNEGLGRKKSKVCCIYHKNREVGESSSEDDSSSSDSDGSGSDGDDGSARPVAGSKGRGRARKRRHDHPPGDDDDCHDGHGHARGRRRKPSPNAYEKMPKYDVKPLERQPGS